MSFKVSYSDIQELMLFYSGVADGWMSGISSVREKELVVEKSNNISGNSADRMKEYLKTVYSVAESMLYEAIQLFTSNLLVYTEDYYQSIDGADNTRIQEKELNERHESLKKKKKAMQKIGEAAEDAVHKISDIISISDLDISSQDEQIKSILTSLENLDEDINALENKHLSADFTELDTLLYRIESFLTDMKNLNKEYKVSFTPQSFVAIPSVMPLLEAIDNGNKTLNAQEEEVQLAADNFGARLERQQKEMEERQKTAKWIKIGVGVIGTIASAVAAGTGFGTLLIPVIVGVTTSTISAIGEQYVANSWDTEKWDTSYILKEAVKGSWTGFTTAFTGDLFHMGIISEEAYTIAKTAVSGAHSAIWGSLDETYDQMKCTGNISDVKSVIFEGAKSGTVDITKNLVGDFIENKVENMPIGKGLDKYEGPSNDIRHYIGNGIKGSTSKMASGIGERLTEATVESGFDIGKNLVEGKDAFKDVPLGERYAKVVAFDELGEDFVNGGIKEVTTNHFKERKFDPKTGTTPVVQESLRMLDNKADYSRSALTPKEELLIKEMEINGEFDLSDAKIGPSSYSSSTMKPLTDEPIEVEFKLKGSKEEIKSAIEQIEGQEERFNFSAVEGSVDRRDHFVEYGRTDTDKDQENYRLGAFETAVDEKIEEKINSIMKEKPYLSYEKASKKVNVDKIRRKTEKEFKKLDALHEPDQVAGGDPEEIHAVGSSGANRSIGSQWHHGRADDMYKEIKEAAKGMTREELENTRLNIKLKYTIVNSKE